MLTQILITSMATDTFDRIRHHSILWFWKVHMGSWCGSLSAHLGWAQGLRHIFQCTFNSSFHNHHCHNNMDVHIHQKLSEKRF